MEVRLCDFGLAIENGGDGEQTICGTPNYIASKVLIRKNSNSYSFEIDIWSFGIILYSLLFHKNHLKQKIKPKLIIILLMLYISFLIILILVIMLKILL